MSLTGSYQTEDILYSSEQTIVYRGKDKQGKPVILKVLNNSHPDPEQLARVRLEYALIRRLQIGSEQESSVIQAYDLVKHHNSLMIVLEDTGGDSLSRHAHAQRMAMDAFLPLAIQISHIVETIHKQLVIHKDINPSNIIWNRHKGLVRLIDFGISTTLTRAHMEIWNQQVLEGTPAYLAPEQTGRMNRPVDFRTDLYSLGATFFYLLTGEAPFKKGNILELIHCHLAKQAQFSPEQQKNIPEMVAAIVLKLLAKEAESRYQTATGLKKDLQTCLEHWQQNSSVPLFPMGLDDVAAQLVFSQRLFGRDQELQILRGAFDRSRRGESGFVFVTGNAGVGKSALINETGSHVLLHGGFFVSGKFNQSEDNTPYGAIIYAFRSLMRQLLTGNDEQLTLWKEKLRPLLESRSAIICRAIPELEIIIGIQNHSYELSPNQSRDQFYLAFLDLVKTISTQETPLTIFMDDLQWSDNQSLQLLERLVEAPDLMHFLLICACRDEDAKKMAPVQAFRQSISRTMAFSHTIHLTPLQPEDVRHLIADSTRYDAQEVEELSAVCIEKTNGNPFFLKQFLLSLYNDGLLHLENGVWRWQLSAIRQQTVTDNVVNLMTDKIRSQSALNQELLKVAACIGHTFDIETLANVLGWSKQETAAACQDILEAGFILPFEGEHKLTAYLDSPKVSYQFIHDRVYQSAYALLNKRQKTKIHYKIGKLLQQNIPSAAHSIHLLRATNHLNLSQSLMPSQEKYQLAELNLRAGRQAMLSAAHQTAYHYFQSGLSIFDQQGWSTHYDLVLQLHNASAHVAYVSGFYHDMPRLVQAVEAHARSLLDTVYIRRETLIAHTSAMQFFAALENGLSLLRLLEEKIPDSEPSEEEVDNAWQRLDGLLGTISAESLLNLPAIGDFQSESVLDVISNIVPVAAIIGSRWMPYLLIAGMQKIIRSGHSPSSVLIVCDFAGMCLCGIRDDMEAGYQFGQVAMRLLEKSQNEQHRMRLFFMYSSNIRHWHEHYLNILLPSYKDGIKNGLDVGDIESVSYIIYIYVAQCFFFGETLSVAEKQIQEYRNQLITIKSLYLLDFVDIIHQAVLNLMGNSLTPHLLLGEKYNEKEKLAKLIQTGGTTILCNVYIALLMLRYLFRQFDDCAALLTQANHNLIALKGSAQVPIFLFFEALYYLAVYPEAPPEQQTKWLEKVENNHARLHKWAQHGPMNLEQMLRLLEAERFRVLKKNAQAQDAYNKAIALSRQHEFILFEALAFELAGYFYQQQGINHLTRYHLGEARYAYARWGATAKVLSFDWSYPGFFLDSKGSYASSNREMQPFSPCPRSTTTKSITETLDLPSIIMASQAISREIDLNKLVHQLLLIVMEYAGAQRSCLISVENGQLTMLAQVTERDQLYQTSEQFDNKKRADFSEEIVRFAIRSKEFLALGDVTNDYHFAHTEYVLRNRSKSILCVPLVYNGQVNRVIYLENNLATHAFTHFQVESVRILGAQAAISLTNAMVINELKSTEQKLLFAQQQSRHISRHQQVILENEQKRISQEIHDELGSLLTRVRIEIELLLDDIEQNAAVDAKESLSDILNHINQAMLTTRRIAFALRPKTLDQCGLLPALEWQAAKYKHLFATRIDPNSKNIRFDDEREIALFRIGQEAITNIVRHASASQVTLFLDAVDDTIIFSISDDGRGIDLQKSFKVTMGIQGMRERAKQLDGQVQICKNSSGGTRVEVTIPRKIDEKFEVLS
ncbi:MAG: AAA family ATPase [Magnetococcales bacterium]|nr:AAA family ATPase [Magnetococcales bacterium]